MVIREKSFMPPAPFCPPRLPPPPPWPPPCPPGPPQPPPPPTPPTPPPTRTRLPLALPACCITSRGSSLLSLFSAQAPERFGLPPIWAGRDALGDGGGSSEGVAAGSGPAD